MIRIEEPSGWVLVGHQQHARLAGEIATHWGNREFAPPEPRADILEAVFRHDDAWAERDAAPQLTREGRPGAFSHELVGSYSAFEEIDLADYLAVRARGTEAVARDNPYAAGLISMHTVNLLTEQADLTTLTPGQRELHTAFIARQRARQGELFEQAGGHRLASDLQPARLQRAFEFLQLCDNLSLVTCVRFPRPMALRHRHPRRDGGMAVLVCTPLSPTEYRVTPFPFDGDQVRLAVPARRVAGTRFATLPEFRAAYASAPRIELEVNLVR